MSYRVGQQQIMGMAEGVAREIALTHAKQIDGPEWHEGRDNPFFVCFVAGKRLVIDLSTEDVEDYPGDSDARRRVDDLVRGLIEQKAQKE